MCNLIYVAASISALCSPSVSLLRFSEVLALVHQFYSSLDALLVGLPSRFVALCGNSSLQWYVTDFACILRGVPTVSVHVVCINTCMYVYSMCFLPCVCVCVCACVRACVCVCVCITYIISYHIIIYVHHVPEHYI